MAWSTENWIQDDTKLSGYPTPAGTAYPEEFSLDGLTSIWHKATSHGYFIPSEDITPFSIDGFATIWLFNNNFDGYPHPAEFPASPLPQKPVKQNEYICIFPSNTHQYDENLQSNFDTNGIAILCPTKCEVIEELNGGYSLTMEHPVDENGIWRNIQLFNILKVQGQLFTIINAEPTYTGSSGKINVYAEHIFYKQNDQWIPPKIENSGGGWDDVYIHRENVYYALMSILDVCFPKEGGEDYFPSFWFWSDVETGERHAEKIETGKTRIDEIFTLINDYGGELWRDNFAYSIEKRMRNAIDNAFDIRVGLNMKGIKRSVDVSNFCTHFSGWDNYGNYVGVSYDSATLPAPNVISRTNNFTYDSEDEYHSMDLLMQDVSQYFQKNFTPKITYTVNLKDVRSNPDYEEYSGIRYKVGDTGKIYDERLGGELTLKITKTKTNGITGEVTEVTFGAISGFVRESASTPVPVFPTLPA